MSLVSKLLWVVFGLIGLTTAALLIPPVRGQILTPEVLSLYSRAVAETDGVEIERGVRYGPGERHKLDVYRPTKDDGTGPIAVFVYGGSWKAGDRAVYGFVGAALASRGIPTVIPDYRLFPEVQWPVFNEDVAEAYAWAATHIAGSGPSTAAAAAPQSGVPHQPARPIILIGHSAGAHIAALLTVDRRYLKAIGNNVPPPTALIGISGPYGFDPTRFESTKDVFATAKVARETRPITFVTKNLPPTLVMHSYDDTLVKPKNTIEFAGALTQHNVPTRRVMFKSVGHIGTVVAISSPFRWRAPVLDEIIMFIREMGKRFGRVGRDTVSVADERPVR